MNNHDNNNVTNDTHGLSINSILNESSKDSRGIIPETPDSHKQSDYDSTPHHPTRATDDMKNSNSNTAVTKTPPTNPDDGIAIRKDKAILESKPDNSTLVYYEESKPNRRFRRRYNQIVRKYSCSFPGCNKSYGLLNHLNTHIVTKKHGQRKSKSDFQHEEVPNTFEYNGNYWYGYMPNVGIRYPYMFYPYQVPRQLPPQPAQGTGGPWPAGVPPTPGYPAVVAGQPVPANLPPQAFVPTQIANQMPHGQLGPAYQPPMTSLSVPAKPHDRLPSGSPAGRTAENQESQPPSGNGNGLPTSSTQTTKSESTNPEPTNPEISSSQTTSSTQNTSSAQTLTTGSQIPPHSQTLTPLPHTPQNQLPPPHGPHTLPHSHGPQLPQTQLSQSQPPSIGPQFSPHVPRHGPIGYHGSPYLPPVAGLTSPGYNFHGAPPHPGSAHLLQPPRILQTPNPTYRLPSIEPPREKAPEEKRSPPHTK